MKIRNAKYNRHGTIDCEIDHPRLGWIPFTASPNDTESLGRIVFADLSEDEKTEPYQEPVLPTETVEKNRRFEMQREAAALVAKSVTFIPWIVDALVRAGLADDLPEDIKTHLARSAEIAEQLNRGEGRA
jgi:hypothetical protein